MNIWYILWPFGNVVEIWYILWPFGNVVKFGIFFIILVHCVKKNLATVWETKLTEFWPTGRLVTFGRPG
jgi:hypothetical protein